jgi:hypothetical protein
MSESAPCPKNLSPNDFNVRCATYPRHLGRLIRRALTCGPMDTVELCSWAYHGQQVRNWMLRNIRRACRHWGFKQIGKRGGRYLWSLWANRSSTILGKLRGISSLFVLFGYVLSRLSKLITSSSVPDGDSSVIKIYLTPRWPGQRGSARLSALHCHGAS